MDISFGNTAPGHGISVVGSNWGTELTQPLAPVVLVLVGVAEELVVVEELVVLEELMVLEEFVVAEEFVVVEGLMLSEQLVVT